jgi:hypothetical protein
MIDIAAALPYGFSGTRSWERPVLSRLLFKSAYGFWPA